MTRAFKVTQWISACCKAWQSEFDPRTDLSLIPERMWWRKRTESCRSSSDHHLCRCAVAQALFHSTQKKKKKWQQLTTVVSCNKSLTTSLTGNDKQRQGKDSCGE